MEEKEKQMVSGPYNHEWIKEEVVTQRDHKGMYNTFKCSKCKATVKFRHLGKPRSKGCMIKDSETEGGA